MYTRISLELEVFIQYTHYTLILLYTKTKSNLKLSNKQKCIIII